MSFISLENIAGEFEPVQLLESNAAAARRLPRGFLRAKRAFDIMLALLLLPIVAIVCAVVFLLNPFLNPGRLFFSQIRIGKDEKPFRMYKLRTMLGSNDAVRLDADETHRVTRFGSFLRAKRLDELPQVVNILLGQMSFIGPRPEQIELYREILGIIPHYGVRQVVRPGISGLAQIESGYARAPGELQTKLRYDLHYIRHMSTAMELYVIGRTFRVMLTGFGAR